MEHAGKVAAKPRYVVRLASVQFWGRDPDLTYDTHRITTDGVCKNAEYFLSMNLVDTMLRSHPHADLQRSDHYTEVLNALTLCVQICTSCADACLDERDHVTKLRRCIRTNLDCADVCGATARLLVRQTETPNELLHAQIHACILACQLCADECGTHSSMHDHCRICAETCRHCQERCNFLLGEISSSGIEESADPTDSPRLSR